MKYYILILLLSFFCLNNIANDVKTEKTSIPKDSLEISLLTCSPGKAIYELYGHTAILVNDIAHKNRWIFNYGMFSFNTKNFIWNFIKGKTDYILGVNYYEQFYNEYKYANRSVINQQINLTKEEKHKLFHLLRINCQSENRTYHYNFLYKNCTTKALDIITKSIDGDIIFTPLDSTKTLHDIIHEATVNEKWLNFGQDLLLGYEIDKKGCISYSFSPLYLKKYFEKAEIRDTKGKYRTLVNCEKTSITKEKEATTAPSFFTPIKTMIIWLILTLLLIVSENKKHKIYYINDLLLFATQGIIGCVICFLTFSSQLPAVDTNMQLFLLQPIALIYLPIEIMKARKRRIDYYHILNICLILCFFIFSTHQEQEINTEVYILAFNLLILSTYRFIIALKQKKNEQ